MSGRDERDYYELVTRGNEPYREVLFRYLLLDNKIPIFPTSGIAYSYQSAEYLVYDVSDNSYPFPYMIITHEIAHGIDNRSEWKSYTMEETIIQDITDNILRQTEIQMVDQLIKAGTTQSEISTMIKNQTLKKDVDMLVDYILDPAHHQDNRNDQPKPKEMSDVNRRTLTAVQNYYRNAFDVKNPENATAGDLYHGLTNGYLEAGLCHAPADWYGDNWDTSEAEINGESLCKEFFSNAFATFFIGDSKSQQAFNQWFPNSSRELVSVVEEMNDYNMNSR